MEVSREQLEENMMLKRLAVLIGVAVDKSGRKKKRKKS